ncbi:unnamed protein product [Malus baccata var. baccata]
MKIPGQIRHGFVVFSLLASVVGSQATITACFSIINQCLALGCFPRVKVIHTSDEIHGQVYIPDINWLLMVLRVVFWNACNDLSTCLMSLVIALYWEKSLFESVCCLIFFWLWAVGCGLCVCRCVSVSHVPILVFEEYRDRGVSICMEESDLDSQNSCEGRMVVVGKPPADGTGSVLIPLNDTNSYEMECDAIESGFTPATRRKVRFMLPPNKLIDARESGTAYFLGQVHLAVRDGLNILKRLLIMTYVFLDKNCREPPVALSIPHAALVEVGMVCCI